MKKQQRAVQLELPFGKPTRRTPIRVGIRVGVLSGIVTRHDIDRIVQPRGEGAVEAFERDISSSFADEDSGADFGDL